MSLLTPEIVDQLNNLMGFPRQEDFELGTYLNELAGLAPDAVWQPGGVAAGNVYTTWPEALAAAQLGGGARSIFIDTTLGAAVIPAGTYDLESRITITGPAVFNPAIVTLSDGVVLQNPSVFDGNVEFQSLSSAPVITVGATPLLMVLNNGFRLTCLGTGPFIDIGVAGLLFLFTDRGQLRTGTQVVIDTTDFTATAVIQMDGTALVQPSTLGGIGLFSVERTSLSAQYQTPQSGAVTVSNLEDSALAAYTPAVLGDWSGIAPQTVAIALDRLAATLGPIP